MGKEDVMCARAHTHRAEYCSTVKKNWNNAFCSNMDGPRVYHTKWSMSEKDKYYITYMWNLKSSTNELIYKTETDSQA